MVLGDLVFAYDERTGEIGEYTVTATISHIDPEIVLLTIDGEWVDAGDLVIGAELLALDGDDGAWLVHNTSCSIGQVPYAERTNQIRRQYNY